MPRIRARGVRASARRYALTLLPLSFVPAIGRTTSLFVFLFGVLLALILPIGAALITAGVTVSG